MSDTRDILVNLEIALMFNFRNAQPHHPLLVYINSSNCLLVAIDILGNHRTIVSGDRNLTSTYYTGHGRTIIRHSHL